MTKIKLVRVLVKRFDKFHHFGTFTFLVSVLLCLNLDSSMLECEGHSSLIFTEKYSVQDTLPQSKIGLKYAIKRKLTLMELLPNK